MSQLKHLSTDAITNVLTTIFEAYGLPRRIRTDGGPQFRGPFATFCEKNGIIHEKSSPYHPQSNGHAEAAVKNAKHLLKKCLKTGEPFSRAFSQWKATPRADGFSPAAMFLGRQPRTLTPSIAPSSIDLDKAAKARRRTQEQEKDKHDEHAKPLKPLNIGDFVRIRHPLTGQWNLKGRISAIRDSGKSYDIKLEDGTTTARNRRYLALTKNPETDTPTNNDPVGRAEDLPQKTAPRARKRNARDSPPPSDSPRLSPQSDSPITTLSPDTPPRRSARLANKRIRFAE